MTLSVPEMLVEDRKLAAEITPAYTDDDRMIAARSAAARHNARLDAPAPAKKGGWDARASAVRVDEDQKGHPWSVIGHGETAGAALDDLVTKLNERPVVTSGPATCPTCGQSLPG